MGTKYVDIKHNGRWKIAENKVHIFWGNLVYIHVHYIQTSTNHEKGLATSSRKLEAFCSFKIMTKITSDISNNKKKKDYYATAIKLILQVFITGNLHVYKDGEDLKTLMLVRHMEEKDGRQHYCKMTYLLGLIIYNHVWYRVLIEDVYHQVLSVLYFVCLLTHCREKKANQQMVTSNVCFSRSFFYSSNSHFIVLAISNFFFTNSILFCYMRSNFFYVFFFCD